MYFRGSSRTVFLLFLFFCRILVRIRAVFILQCVLVRAIHVLIFRRLGFAGIVLCVRVSSRIQMFGLLVFWQDLRCLRRTEAYVWPFSRQVPFFFV